MCYSLQFVLFTAFRALWTAHALYARFDATDPDPWHTMSAHDDCLWEEEVVELFLDPAGQGRDYFELEISPANVTCDVRVRTPYPNLVSELAWDHVGLATAVCALRDQTGTVGWTAAAELPWGGFRSLPVPAHVALPPESETAGASTPIGSSGRVVRSGRRTGPCSKPGRPPAPRASTSPPRFARSASPETSVLPPALTRARPDGAVRIESRFHGLPCPLQLSRAATRAGWLQRPCLRCTHAGTRLALYVCVWCGVVKKQRPPVRDSRAGAAGRL